MGTSKSRPAEEDLVPIGTAADIAGVHRNTLRRWTRDGLIPAYKTPSGRLRFKVADLQNLHSKVETGPRRLPA